MHTETTSATKEFASWYQGCFPLTIEKGMRKIGIEKEYPVVVLDSKEAGDARVILKELSKAGWVPVYDDYYTDVVLAVRDKGFEVTTDAGYCTLEISGPPMSSITDAVEAFARVEQEAVNAAARHGLEVLGYGIQPVTLAHRRLWIQKRRHEVIRRTLSQEISAITITASDQVHIDFTQAELFDAVNVFNALTAVFSLFFANSPIHGGGIDKHERLIVREDSWRHAGVERSGIPLQRFADNDHLMGYIANLPLLIAKQSGDYITPQVPFIDWMNRHDKKEDWHRAALMHEASIWFDARPRASYGTVEMRSPCSQRKGEHAQVAALMMGLAEELPRTKALVQEVESWTQWFAMKNDANKGTRNALTKHLMTEVLRCAEDGLRSRGLREEMLLPPLWERLKERSNPATEALYFFNKGGMPALVEWVAIKPE